VADEARGIFRTKSSCRGQRCRYFPHLVVGYRMCSAWLAGVDGLCALSPGSSVLVPSIDHNGRSSG
jgi:hypothetical protein